jgi:hypothetical protein
LSADGVSTLGNAERPKISLQRSADFSIDEERRLVTAKFGRMVTVEDIADYAKRLLAHPKFQPSFSEITDLREAEELDLGAYDFLRLADQIDPFLPDAKRAFVVRTSVQLHAARLHKMLRSKRDIEIFESFEAAEEWIHPRS